MRNEEDELVPMLHSMVGAVCTSGDTAEVHNWQDGREQEQSSRKRERERAKKQIEDGRCNLLRLQPD